LIGVGVTTRNRPKELAHTLEQVRKHTPDAVVVVVDDASTPAPESDYRFDRNVGIARAKNKCIELLYGAGCQHLFLFDDDTYPVVDGWYKPYVDAPAAHLMYIFQDNANTPTLVHDDGQVQAWSNPRGCMLYVTRECVDTVGGMDTHAWGKWGGEHADWSTRIFNAGLTHWRFADVNNSGELIYCADQDGKVKSTTPDSEKQAAIQPVMKRLAERERTAVYANFREPVNAVLTCMYTSVPDPQRPRTPQKGTVDVLRKSVRGAELHLISDTERADAAAIMPVHLNLYLQRHVHYYEYLLGHPEIEQVFCVDATDVEMLNEPWDAIQRDRLYIGYEPRPLNFEWMFKEHQSTRLQQFFTDNADLPLLNAGVYGGHRVIVLEFLHEIIRLIQDNAVDLIHERDTHDLGNGDMGALNYVARTRFADRIVSGPRVTTVFKADERNSWSWFKHK